MIEESETVGPDPAQGGIEGDLLAQRRARRAELSDPALIRRAEVAEATVRTLETHLNSLQQRLQDTGDEQRRMSDQLAEREREVRRVKQREYAEQQLRVEVEERCEIQSSEKRAEVEELHRRLSVSERHAHELADQLEGVRLELAEAQQVAAAERMVAQQEDEELAEREAQLQQRELELTQSAAEIERHLTAAREFERRASALRERAQEREDILTTRLAELERRATEVQQEVETQQIARERSELTLGRVQESHTDLRLIVRELEQAAKQLRGAIEQERATLQQEFDRKREELAREHTAEIERERERLNAQQAGQIADAQAQIATHIAELEDQREQLSKEQAEQFAQAQQESANRIAELESQREQLSREHAAQLEQASQLSAQLELQRAQLGSEHAEKLEQMRSRVRELEGELERTAADLHEEAIPSSVEPAEHSPSAEIDNADIARKREMSEALAAAVKRLRARVATDEELRGQSPAEAPAPVEPKTETQTASDIPQPPVSLNPPTPSASSDHEPAEGLAPAESAETVEKPELLKSPEPVKDSEPAENLEFVARVLPTPKRPPSWIASSLRRIAERGEARLALEIVAELFPLRHLDISDPMTYSVEVEELGEYLVKLDGKHSTAKEVTSPSLEKAVDFQLRGNLLSVGELAAGSFAGKKISGLKVRGSRRRARKLLRASVPPVVLGDIARAGKAIWPGLLLAAVAGAIDPEWTKGQRFVVAFRTTGESGMTVCLRVNDGQPIETLRPYHGEITATVSLSDLALTCLLGRAPLPNGETPLVEGDSSALERVVRWSDRAQGLETSA
jgi:hypothetical protein